jgi:predicted N-acetyltransferase YhbS
MELTLRITEKKDYKKTEELTRAAFWNKFKPGCDEHYLLHQLRKSPIFIKELDYVAEENGEIVGNIVYSTAKIVSDDGGEYEALTFGPVSVWPHLQKKGIGSALIRLTLDKAKEMGFKGVIIYGDPAYYPRFGFVNAMKYGILTRDGESMEPFMALELIPDGFKGITGRFMEVEGVDFVNGFEEFDSLFR